jgi:hypothetical protein
MAVSTGASTVVARKQHGAIHHPENRGLITFHVSSYEQPAKCEAIANTPLSQVKLSVLRDSHLL